jgi:multidrug efflux pump subunit AcrA (membrane-fusion protein)
LRRRLALALLIACAAGAARADDNDAKVKPVKLQVEIQHKLGLTVVPLAAAVRTATVAGFAKALDPGPLAQLDADIDAAQAAAEASRAEAVRSRTLNAASGVVSTKALEAADAQAKGDAARVASLRRRVGLEWGEGLARLSDSRRGALLADLSAGRAALLRIDTASGQGQAGLKSVDIDLGAMGRAHATVLGVARAADPRLLSPGLIAVVRGPLARSFSTGLSVPVKLTTSGPVHGVLAPRDALLRSGGMTWVYLRTSPEAFLRHPVENGMVDPAGLFTPTGLRPGDPVVTQGAAALFAAETNPVEPGAAKDGDD